MPVWRSTCLKITRFCSFQHLAFFYRYLASRHLQNDKDSTIYVCNGRVGKPADVCYSWWVLATIILLIQNTTQHHVLHYFGNKQEKKWYEYEAHIGQGILKFQHVQGGFCKCLPCDIKQSSMSYMFGINQNTSSQVLNTNADVYHTFFSLAALSLIAQNNPYQNFVLLSVNPVNAFISELPALDEC
jgi:prenyltransferase beta subunit